MYAITENYAGGARKRHRTIEAAARRIARQDDVYLGYRLVNCDSDETRDAIAERVEQMRDADAGY